MLYFVGKNGREYTWHVGNLIPDLNCQCVEVQADGHELEFLLKNFRNLPHVEVSVRRIQQWKGSLSQFIYDNLPGERVR
jgi:hypothetical protein